MEEFSRRNYVRYRSWRALNKVFLVKRIASVPAVWIGWVIARLVLIYLLKIDHNPRGDVAYYFAGLFGDDPTMMTEYPHSGTWPTVVLGWLTGENITAFYIGFTIMTLLVDAAFLALLLRHHATQPRSFQAAWFWVLFGTAAGHTFVWRLDIFPALAVAGAAALLATRPLIASAVLGFATTMKLWPGVLAAGLVGRFNRSATWQRLLAFFCTIVAVCTVTIAASGTERLLSPLNYQGVRGLQLESIPATFLLLQAHRTPGRWHLGYAPSKSFEISGPGVDTAMTWSTIATIVMLVFAVGWALYRLCAGGWTTRTTMAFFTVMVLLLIATNKVFSPQYIVWLGPLLAVVIRQRLPQEFAPLRIFQALLASCTIIAAVLGTLVYPFNYDYIWNHVGENMFAVYLLVARNILIVVMAIIGLVWFAVEVALASKIEQAQMQQQAPNAPEEDPAASTEAKPVFRRRRGRHALAS